LAGAALPETKAKLAAQVEQAMTMGIFGAPNFIVANELFQGNDRLEQAIDWAAAFRR
jgi:2-hydroxychromene-2-carboxylate isomerase